MYVGQVTEVPKILRAMLADERQKDPLIPGFLMGLLPPVGNNQRPWPPGLTDVPSASAKASPLVYVPARQTPWIFKREAELDLLRTIVAAVAGQIHPHAKVAVNGAWLVYGAAKLREEWSRPDRDTSACVFRMIGLTAGLLELPGDVSSDFKLPDAWGNGINVFLKCEDALYHGKTLSPFDTALPTKIYKAVEAASLSHSPRFGLTTLSGS
jgi:hypothetical protein